MYDRGLCRPLAAGWTHSCPPTRLCCPACVRAKRPGVRWFSTALRRPATKNQQSPVIPKEKTCRRVAQVCGARPSPGAATCPPCQCRVVTFTNRPVFSCFCTCRQGASEFPALTGLDPLSAARIDPTPAPFPSGEPPVCNVRHAERLILKAVKNKRKASLQPPPWLKQLLLADFPIGGGRVLGRPCAGFFHIFYFFTRMYPDKFLGRVAHESLE